jgi:hypothetical protein
MRQWWLKRQVDIGLRQMEAVDSWISRQAAEPTPSRPGQWDGGQHLFHSVIVGHGILDVVDQLCQSSAEEGKPTTRFAPWVSAILLMGWLPRGRAKSPERFHPPEQVDLRQLERQSRELSRRLGDARGRISEILSAKGRYAHPVLGPLSAGQWLRFLVIHTHHHWKIVRGQSA